VRTPEGNSWGFHHRSRGSTSPLVIVYWASHLTPAPPPRVGGPVVDCELSIAGARLKVRAGHTAARRVGRWRG
jgi:hypothetical protein